MKETKTRRDTFASIPSEITLKKNTHLMHEITNYYIESLLFMKILMNFLLIKKNRYKDKCF